MDVERFKELPLMAILRGGNVDIIDALLETVTAAGVNTLEIAMNTPNAAAMIERAVVSSAQSNQPQKLMIGAGTVTTDERLGAALAAGASFVVMPNLIEHIVERAVAARIPVFPGALTPQEVFRASKAGATMVKLFPAKTFGPGYIRELKGPFDEIELLACGGVNQDNLATFFDAGASAVAFGGSVFSESRLLAGHFDEIGADIEGLVRAYDAFKSTKP